MDSLEGLIWLKPGKCTIPGIIPGTHLFAQPENHARATDPSFATG